MDSKDSEVQPVSRVRAGEVVSPEVDLGRRGFVQRSGRALYVVPSLALLGIATEATAQCSGLLCPPGSGSDLAPGPEEPPAPNE